MTDKILEHSLKDIIKLEPMNHFLYMAHERDVNLVMEQMARSFGSSQSRLFVLRDRDGFSCLQNNVMSIYGKSQQIEDVVSVVLLFVVEANGVFIVLGVIL